MACNIFIGSSIYRGRNERGCKKVQLGIVLRLAKQADGAGKAPF